MKLDIIKGKLFIKNQINYHYFYIRKDSFLINYINYSIVYQIIKFLIILKYLFINYFYYSN